MNDIGDRVRLFATFKGEDGDVADPDAVYLLVRKPDGTVVPITDLTHTVEGSGYYSAEVDVDQSGRWDVHWEGTGAVTAAEESSFYVRPQLVTA